MYRRGAILLPVLIILVILSFVLGAGIFYLYQNEYTQNIKLQGQIAELENRQRSTASQLEASKQAATELELKLQETKRRMDALAEDLAVEKAAHAQTSAQLEQFQADLSNQRALREELENRLVQVQTDSQQIKEQIKIIQQQKIELEEKIKNLEIGASGVELGTVVVNPEVAQLAEEVLQGQAAAKTTETKTVPPVAKFVKSAKKEQVVLAQGQEGKVLVVNNEFNFAVINLGSKDKVSVGDEFLVSRAGQSIGDLKVEKVHEFMSAAGFAPQLKDLIKENDKVMQKIK